MNYDDLPGLEITQGELRHLIGIDPSEIARPIAFKNSQDVWNFLLQEILIAVALMPLIVGFLYTFIILPIIGPSIPIAIAIVGITPVVIILVRWFWQKKNYTHCLSYLITGCRTLQFYD